jgi:hypothetical protein
VAMCLLLARLEQRRGTTPAPQPHARRHRHPR